MKNVVLSVSIVFCFYFIHQTIELWQEFNDLKNKDLRALDELKEIKNTEQMLNSLKDAPVGLLEDEYQNINKQIKLLSRNYDLKVSMEFVKARNDVLLLENNEASRWLGIEQIPLRINFSDLKGLDQYMLVLMFLENLEVLNSLEILEINQTGSLVQAIIQLYGRGK